MTERAEWRAYLPPTIAQLDELAADLRDRFSIGCATAAEIVGATPGGQSRRDVSMEQAQEATAKAYGVESWERMTLACRMVAALRQRDGEEVLRLIDEHPRLLHEHAAGIDNNWGPPMSYAANLGLTELVVKLAEQGAPDKQHALTRATLQGKIETAETLIKCGAQLERGMVMGCCETLNIDGLRFLVDNGAEICDADGNRDAPLPLLLQTYCRNPSGKHACLELLEQNGFVLPDTPIMAFHLGRIDRLAHFLKEDPNLLGRRFSLREIYPAEAGCHEDLTCGLHGTPLDGTTLLHMSADFNEIEVAEWLLKNAADPNARGRKDDDGFGDHTPIFNTVVSMAAACSNSAGTEIARLLLDHGADPLLRASVRKQLKYWHDEKMYEFPDVTASEYAERFQAPGFVSQPALKAIQSASSV